MDQSTPSAPQTMLLRGGSLVFAAAVAVVIATDPALAGSHGTLAQRAAGAAMMVGAIACLLHAIGLRGRRTAVRWLTHPGVAWPLVLAGLIAAGRV